MKILILLALAGVILVNSPPPAAGLKCVTCSEEGPLKCEDYKKGDTRFEQTCPKIENVMRDLSGDLGTLSGDLRLGRAVCMWDKGGRGCSIEPIGKPGSCREDVCFCDTDLCTSCDEDLCNKGALGGGLSAGILVIFLGVIFRQLFH